MFDALVLRILSTAISVVLLSVPREYEHRLREIPDLGDRAKGFDLRGWTYQSITSPATGKRHFYFRFACVRPRAPTMLLLHGFNTNGRAFLNLSSLADTFHLISYNLPEASEAYSGHLDDFTGLLDDFCASVNIDTAVLVGNSLGGAIALRFCAANPATHIERLILISSFVGGATEWERGRNRIVAAKLARYPDHKLLYLAEKFTAALARLGRAGVAEDFPKDIVVLKHPAWYRQVLSGLAQYDGRESARAISQPVLILHGSADRIVTPESGAAIAEFVPHARLEILQDKGHAMIYTDGDLVAQRIRAWLLSGS